MKSTSQSKYHGYVITACGAWAAGTGGGKHGGRWHVSDGDGAKSRCTAGATHYMTLPQAKESIDQIIKPTAPSRARKPQEKKQASHAEDTVVEPPRRSFWSRIFGV